MRKYKILLVLLLIVATSSCSSLVATHNLTGSVLLSTHDSAIVLHQNKVLSDSSYGKIRVAWLRAQVEYVKASVLLEKYLNEETDNLTLYSETMTAISTLLADIAIWMEKK